MRRRYTIFDEMRRMQEQMDNMFENFFSNDPFMERNNLLLEGPSSGKKGELITSSYKQPLSDIYETDKEVIAEVDMPGMDKKDIQVHVDKDGIEIKAETKAETKHEDKKKGMYRFERNYSGFYRHFSLPNNVNAEKANAEYKDGVLKIIVPKLKIEEQKRKLIDVK